MSKDLKLFASWTVTFLALMNLVCFLMTDKADAAILSAIVAVSLARIVVEFTFKRLESRDSRKS